MKHIIEPYLIETFAAVKKHKTKTEAVVTADELLACIREFDEDSALNESLKERMPLSFQLADVWAKLVPYLPCKSCLSSSERPLEGKCIVYGGSLFLNSLPPLVALTQMGAKLFIADCLHGGEDFKEILSRHMRVFRMPEEVDSLVKSLDESEVGRPVVCIDNGALLRKFLSGRTGLLRRARFVEGTLKGDVEFWDYDEPTAGFLSMNSTPVKLPEASMGTPDGFLRHLSSSAVRQQLKVKGFDPNFTLQGRHLVVIGAGKVGLGCSLLVCRRWLSKYNMKLTILEKVPAIQERARQALVSLSSTSAVEVATKSDVDTLKGILMEEEPGNCIICTCTGVAGLLSRFFSGVIKTLEERRPLLVNMAFDDECGELVPLSLDPLELRTPPLPINWVYATADEPPTADCIWDSMAAGLALGSVYLHACYTEDAVGSHENIVAPVALSGCLLSEFLKVLPRGLQEEVEQIYGCFPEIKATLTRYHEISSDTKVLRLHKLDRNVFGHVSTISIYETISGNLVMSQLLAFIQERVNNIVKMNPWLAGKLVRDLQTDELVLKLPGDASTPTIFVQTKRKQTQFDPSNVDMDYLLEIASATDAIVTDANEMLVADADDIPYSNLFKVTLIEMMGIESNWVGLVTSMNHKIADGHTCYKILGMLHSSSEHNVGPWKMIAARDLSFAQDSAVDSLRFVEGIGGDRHNCVLEISKIGVAKLKKRFNDSHAPEEKFISTIDVLSWLLSEAVGAEMCCTMMNLRGRMAGINTKMAGNYIGAASFVQRKQNNGGEKNPEEQSKFTPCSFAVGVVQTLQRAANGHYTSLGDAVEKFPKTSPNQSPVLVMTDWSSICDHDPNSLLPGLELVGHYPLVPLVWNPGCIAMPFKKKPNVLALCISVWSKTILKRVCHRLHEAGVLA